jgi:SMI1-KNR4 cell-wall
MDKRIIAPRGGEWANLSGLPAQIATWEAQVRLALPAPYKRFLLDYGGGHVYPNLFHSKVPPEVLPSADDLAICDRLYGWDYALEQWNGGTYGNGTPPQMFFIGADPGGIELLMSLRPKDAGAIYAWVASSWEWGTPENDEKALFLQDKTFSAFVLGLFDTPDGLGYAAWKTPRRELLARDLILT